jgi:DNA-binding NarL/FixJ family response regulator
MGRVVNTAIIEDDPFARMWMSLLIARDWRTHLVLDVLRKEFSVHQLRTHPPIKVVLLSLDELADYVEITAVIGAIRETIAARIVGIGVYLAEEWVRSVESNGLDGYLIKEELGDSLAWAVAYAARDEWVMTPSVQRAFARLERPFQPKSLVIDGRQLKYGLQPEDARLARLALLYSMERKDLADEQGTGHQVIMNRVSELYEHLFVDDPHSEKPFPEERLSSFPVLQRKLEKIYAERGDKVSGSEKEAIAFHLITEPVVTRLESKASPYR